MGAKSKQKKSMTLSLCVFTIFVLLTLTVAQITAGYGLSKEPVIWCLVLTIVALMIFALSAVEYFLTDNAYPAEKEDTVPACGITVSDAKLTLLQTLFGEDKPLTDVERAAIKKIIKTGDIQPAVVISLSPFLVAAYSEEMDCVSMLHFPERMLDAYVLIEGSRLITANAYRTGQRYARDLIQPAGKSLFSNMHPVIVDFIASDLSAVSDYTFSIPEWMWLRATELGVAYVSKMPECYRSGNPRISYKPAEG